MENINEQFKRLFCELDLTDDQAAMINKLQKDVDAALHQPPVSSECEHPYYAVLGDGEMQPAKCLKCGKVL